MARFDGFPEPMRSHLADLPCLSIRTHPWAEGPDLSQRRAALIFTAVPDQNKEKCLDETDEMMRMNGKLLLVPMDQG